MICTAARYRTAALPFLASLLIGAPYSSKVDKRRLAEDHKILRTLQTRTADASLEGSHGSVSTVTFFLLSPPPPAARYWTQNLFTKRNKNWKGLRAFKRG